MRQEFCIFDKKVANQSQHEADVAVLQSISTVNAAEISCGSSVIGGESSPDVIPDDGHLSSGILLDAPHAVWLVAVDLIEEVWLENCIISK